MPHLVALLAVAFTPTAFASIPSETAAASALVPASQDIALQEAAPVGPQWKGDLSLGATWTDGNTESSSVNATFKAERRGADDRWAFDAFVNYGDTTDKSTGTSTVTTNNSGASAKYDYFYSKRTFFYGNASHKVDHVADLDLRAIVGAGVGYQWVEGERLEWATDAGLSYVDEDFGDNAADADFAAARVASTLAYQISKTASFAQLAEILPSLEDSDDLIAKVDSKLKLNIFGKWNAFVQHVLDFDDSVPNGNDEADHRVVVGVTWGFGG